MLISSASELRFVPNADFNGVASIEFHAWDGSAHAAGDVVSVASTGGATAFSLLADTATITVSPVNDAPVLDTSPSPQLTGIVEDDAGSAGTLVSSLLGGASDVDGDAVGIAVIGVDDANGTWQVSSDGGVTFVDIGFVSTSNALLVADASMLRFAPNADYNGDATIEFHAWDGSAHAEGDVVSVATAGGSSAFSLLSETATIAVAAVNDAPTLDTTGAPAFTDVVEDAVSPMGDLVSDIVRNGSMIDVDDNAVEAIALTAADNTNGAWQYSIDGGTSFTDVGSVSEAQALLLDGSAMLRFVPTSGYTGTADISYRAWDQSTGANGQSNVDTTTNGGATAFSTAIETGTLTVTPAPVVNTAPTMAAGGGRIFDGADDRIDMGDNHDIGNGDMTVEAWFYWDGTNEKQTIVSKGGSLGAEEGYRIIVYNGELIVGASTGGLGSDSNTAASRVTLTSQGWHHVALVVDQESGGDASTVTGYLNGSSAGWTAGSTLAADDTFTAGDINTSESLLIGADTAYGASYYDNFNDAIADVRIWDKARSAADIQADMTRTLNGDETNLVGNWMLDGIGATASNRVAGGVDGSTHSSPNAVNGANVATRVNEAVFGRMTADDVDGDGLTFSVLTDATNGSATIDAATGVWQYTPHASYSGVDSVTFQVDDGAGGTDTVTVNLTVTNNIAPTAIAAAAVDFSVGDFEASVDNDALNPGTGDFTAEAWFYHDGTLGTTGMILSDGNEDANKEGYSIFVDNGNLVVRVSDGGNADQMTAASHIDLGSTPGWKHVSMVIDQTNGEVRGYLDGDAAGWTAGYGGVADAAFDPGDLKPNEAFMIGATEKNSDVDKFGTMPVADVRLWSVAKSEADIAADMTRALNGDETNLLANWRLDEGSGATASDNSSNGYDAVGLDAAAWLSTATVTTAQDVNAHGRVTATDTDGDALTYAVAANGANGVATIDADTGAWEYDPDAGFTGTDMVSYQVSDGLGGVDTVTITINVT